MEKQISENPLQESARKCTRVTCTAILQHRINFEWFISCNVKIKIKQVPKYKIKQVSVS